MFRWSFSDRVGVGGSRGGGGFWRILRSLYSTEEVCAEGKMSPLETVVLRAEADPRPARGREKLPLEVQKLHDSLGV